MCCLCVGGELFNVVPYFEYDCIKYNIMLGEGFVLMGVNVESHIVRFPR
jgi:hypothetical protein